MKVVGGGEIGRSRQAKETGFSYGWGKRREKRVFVSVHLRVIQIDPRASSLFF